MQQYRRLVYENKQHPWACVWEDQKEAAVISGPDRTDRNDFIFWNAMVTVVLLLLFFYLLGKSNAMMTGW